jgi:HAD superfamily hydrolase (TIGR01509 family)
LGQGAVRAGRAGSSSQAHTFLIRAASRLISSRTLERSIAVSEADYRWRPGAAQARLFRVSSGGAAAGCTGVWDLGARAGASTPGVLLTARYRYATIRGMAIGSAKPHSGIFDKRRIDAVLFDLDGTLMDTDDQAVEALGRRLARLRLRDPYRAARHLVMAFECPGNALMTLLDIVGLDRPLSSVTGHFYRWRGLRPRSDLRIMEGAAGMIAALDGRYGLAVVTTRGRADADAFLSKYALSPHFGSVVTRESTWRLKPHPAPIRLAAQELSVPVERCAMVGDTTVDVKAARRAGAWAVAVLCGFGSRDELERAGANVVLEYTADIEALL